MSAFQWTLAQTGVRRHKGHQPRVRLHYEATLYSKLMIEVGANVCIFFTPVTMSWP